jgi:hypothetical protein
MPKLILQKCTQCCTEKARNSNFSFTKSTGYATVCRTCSATDPRKKTCSKCGEEKSYRNFYATGKGTTRDECIICFNKRRKPKVEVEVTSPRVTANPWENLGLEWRNGVPRDPYSQSNRYD